MRYNELKQDTGAAEHRNCQLREEVQESRLKAQRLEFDLADREREMGRLRDEFKESRDYVYVRAPC